MRVLGALLTSTAIVVGTGAVLAGRVVRAERRAILPPALRIYSDGRPAIIVFGAQTSSSTPRLQETHLAGTAMPIWL